MIPATHSYEARFRHPRTDADGLLIEHTYTTLPVIAWDNEGNALVCGTRKLQRADTWANFHDLQPADAPVVSAVPGAGWIAEYTGKDDTIVASPIVAWAVRADGTCTAIDTDSSGYSDVAHDAGNFKRLHHPDIPETA